MSRTWSGWTARATEALIWFAAPRARQGRGESHLGTAIFSPTGRQPLGSASGACAGEGRRLNPFWVALLRRSRRSAGTNFLNNPDGIQGHNFSTQIAHVYDRRVLQGRLTLVRYNNEPQFFLADANVFFGLIADVLDRLGPHADADTVDAEMLTRLKDAIALLERKASVRERA